MPNRDNPPRLPSKDGLSERDAGSPLLHYFALLDAGAREAADRGDYGIAALGIIRGRGCEVRVVGTNTIFSEGDPMGHAECNVLRAVAALARTPDLLAGGMPFGHIGFEVVADPQANEVEFILLTSLEPCPMCTVAIINSGVQKVLYLSQDEGGGAMSPEHQDRLPPIFARFLNERLSIEQLSPHVPQQREISASFTRTSKSLDASLETEGTVRVTELADLLARASNLVE